MKHFAFVIAAVSALIFFSVTTASAKGHHSHHSGSHGHHHSSGHHSHHGVHHHIKHFINSAVSGAGNAAGRDAVNAVVKSAKTGAPAPASHAAATQSRGASGVHGAADLSHCPGFVQAMKAHGDDPAYAARLKTEAPECFTGAAPAGASGAPTSH